MSTRLYGTSAKIASQAVIDLFAKGGGILIANTAQVNGRFCRIYALAATVIATMTTEQNGLIQTNNDTDGIVTAVPLPAGAYIDGNITSITLTSGTVIAYYQ